MSAVSSHAMNLCKSSDLFLSNVLYAKPAFVDLSAFNSGSKKLGICGEWPRSKVLAPVMAIESSKTTTHVNDRAEEVERGSKGEFLNNENGNSSGKGTVQKPSSGNSTNIVWHNCSVEKSDRERLLNQKGCVIWITGLSGSGKSTVACSLSNALHAKGKLSYILDGDNCRHGLNRDLTFKAEDRVENIRRMGEVAKLFADAGVICIASLISPFQKDRDACRALLPEGDFIEVYMDVPLQICEARDPKGLYKLARAGKIKGFTGIDDPYEPPSNPEIVLSQRQGSCDAPDASAEIVISYLERKGYLEA
ncbi:adenylyl-sulfate kinase 3-like [Andrographis paniculata]|uniref:adenylyl-sulfate kinase 3-like n=1 Tax=Andrographis paniculata TaxID=175694 RepID=UPI0021E8CCEF|nr:adenylyl-sulfate kinase 3-like [Andrographis paniculata]